MNVSLSAEVEKLVNAKIKSGRYTSVSEVIEEALRLLNERDRQQQEEEVAAEARPIWEVFEEIMKEVPAEELNKLPADAAEQHDHYIYGLPKRGA